jgi:hypothetical protein
MPFASQTHVKFNDWWSQTYPPAFDDAQLQTDTCFHEDKQIQWDAPKEHKLVQTIVKGPLRQVKKPESKSDETQTIQPILGNEILLFAELRAEPHEERIGHAWQAMDTDDVAIKVRKPKTKKAIKRESSATQTDRKETAYQLMQAELICQPEKEWTEIVMSHKAQELTAYSMRKAKPIRG